MNSQYTMLVKFIPAILLQVALLNSAYAAMPPAFKPDRLSFELKNEYYTTTENYDEFGDRVNLNDQNSYTNLTSTLDVTYFLNVDLALTAGSSVAYAKSESIEDRTNSEVTDFHGKAQYKIYLQNFNIVPEAEGIFALKTIDTFSDEVTTNEGVFAYKVGTWAIVDVRGAPFKAYGYLGYQYRTDGRSSLLPWTFGLGWRSPRWRLMGELGGYKSITDDEYSDDQRDVRDTYNSQVNAGSFRYYAVNPSIIEARLDFAFYFTPWISATAGYIRSVVGESTAAGQSVLVGLTYSLDPYVESKARRKSEKSKRERRNKQFQHKLEDDYDDQLFEDTNEDAPDIGETNEHDGE